MLTKVLLGSIGLLLLGIPLAASATQCLHLTRTLSLGSRGTDVAALQQFLVSQNLLTSSSVTSYYGSLTQSAVKKFQCAQSIVCSGSPFTTGWGSVAPKTRAVIATLTCLPPPPPTMSCTWNGQTIPNGSSVTAYQSSSVLAGQMCTSEQRTCTNGILNGSYSYPSCTVQSAQSCTFNGQTIPSGLSITAYQSPTVPAG
jgi:peptidoglycan hydrolase-like protein with peptidoglycan-binding domain